MRPAAYHLLLLALAATATFLATGLHVLWCLPLGLCFLLAGGASLVRREDDRRAALRSRRLVLALALGFAGAWLGVAHRDYAPDHPLEWHDWQQQRGVGNAHFETRVLGGFPLQRIEGHGGGGAREHLPAGKGLGTLVANFAILTALAGLLAATMARRAVGWAAGFALLLGLPCLWQGCTALLWMLD